MRILLDTHILLWALTNDRRLSDKARRLIIDEENDVYYSILSLWEVELKHLAHPDDLKISSRELAGYCEQSGYRKLQLQNHHIFALGDLRRKPDAPVHKDPFDKLLICQASAEGMTFVTHDILISGYEGNSVALA